MSNLSIGICGAGMGGLAAAIALRQAGHAVRVFFQPVFDRFGDDLEAAGADPDNGWGNVIAAIATALGVDIPLADAAALANVAAGIVVGKVGTAAAGAVQYALLPFIAAILLARGIRYFALAGLVMVIGERAQDWIQKHEGKIMAGGILLFLGLLVWMVLR